MAIRREYHEALANAGMTLDYVVGEIKDIIGKTNSDGTKLKALQTILRSIGLDKYEKQEDSGKTWEEVILKAIEEKDRASVEVIEISTEEYEVKQPKIPESAKNRMEEEKKLADELYGK